MRKIYFTLKNNRIDSYSDLPMDLAEGEIQYEIETNIKHDKIRNCDYIDGELVYNSDYEKEIEIMQLRNKRSKVCFPIINRGQLWYNHLTEEQLQELDIWYQAWLDITETLIIPEKPS